MLPQPMINMECMCGQATKRKGHRHCDIFCLGF